jgi:putative PIN family toxin of toxin-antitoxin system
MTEEPLRVVFDTMIFLQAVGSGNGPAFAALQRFEAGDFRLFVSEQTLDEVRDVLSRPEIRRKMPLLTEERVTAFMVRVQSRATLVTGVGEHTTLPHDPDDEPVLNLALEARSDYLVTRDRDLLDLMAEGAAEGEAFRSRFPRLIILDPAAFLRELS